MFSHQRFLGTFAAGLLLALNACGSSADGTAEPAAPKLSGRASNVQLYTESGEPLALGAVPDPAIEEGSGDVDAGTPGTSPDAAPPPAPADTGAPGSADAGPPAAPDSGSPAAPDTGSPAAPDTGSPSSADAGPPAPAPGPSPSPAPTPSPSPSPSPSPTPGAIGATLVSSEAFRELTAMKSSTYSHTTTVDESTGQFDFDCSGFVGYDLSRSLPDALATLSAATTARPLAKDFEEFFAAIPAGGATGRWHRVVRAADLAPGDVVAWLKPADVASSNTGHVLVVRLPVTRNPARADEILVPITDSTSTPHGATDSRTATGATGLGTGTIGLLVDAAGAPIGYRWTGGVSTHDEYTTVSLGHAQ